MLSRRTRSADQRAKNGRRRRRSAGSAITAESQCIRSRVTPSAPDQTATDSSITFIEAKPATPSRTSRSRPSASISGRVERRRCRARAPRSPAPRARRSGRRPRRRASASMLHALQRQVHPRGRDARRGREPALDASRCRRRSGSPGSDRSERSPDPPPPSRAPPVLGRRARRRRRDRRRGAGFGEAHVMDPASKRDALAEGGAVLGRGVDPERPSCRASSVTAPAIAPSASRRGRACGRPRRSVARPTLAATVGGPDGAPVGVGEVDAQRRRPRAPRPCVQPSASCAAFSRSKVWLAIVAVLDHEAREGPDRANQARVTFAAMMTPKAATRSR